MVDNVYFNFPYGSLFYGSQTPAGVVPQVQNLYAIREPDYYILKWDAPPYDSAGNPVIPQAYVIYRTEHVNFTDSVELAIVNTLDYTGNIDTCYVDSSLPDPTKDYYYSVVVVNQAGYPSRLVNWVTDYKLSGVDKYYSAGLYTSQKLNYFYNILNTLTTFDIFDTSKMVIPNKKITKLQGSSYVPDNNYLFLDFFPVVPSGTVLDVYLNSVKITSGINRSFFYVTIPYIPPKQTFTIEVRDQSGSTLYKRRDYTSYDYLIFPSAVAKEFNDVRMDMEILKNNLWKDECNLSLIYQNFGSFFGFPPPPYFVTTEYKDTIVGNGTDKPGLVSAGMDGGTVAGIKEAIQSITGLQPDITYYRNILGWVVRDKKTTPIKKMCIIRYDKDDHSTDYIHSVVTDGGYYPGVWGGMEIWGTNQPVTAEPHTVSGSSFFTLSYPPVPFTPPWSGPDPLRMNAYWMAGAVKHTLVETDVTTPGTTQFHVNYITGNLTVNSALIGKIIYVDYYNARDDAIRYWGGNGTDGGIGWPVGYSGPFKGFSLHIKVYGSVKTVSAESVICSGFVDYLSGGNILLTSPTPTPGVYPPVYPALPFTVTDSLGFTYNPGVDFTLDQTNGTIIWNSPSPCPVNRVYYVGYTFSYATVVKNMVKQIKFPQTNIVYHWL